jgi:N-acetylneuraminic acid mutarotase
MSRPRAGTLLLGIAVVVTGCAAPVDRDPTGPEATSAAPAALATSNTWTPKRSLSPWRQAMAAGTINGIIYVAGGQRSGGMALARVDAYNPATDTWSAAASMPGARAEPHGASMIGGKLYVTGGWNASGVSTRTLFVYDPGTNTWSRKADIPQPGCGGTQGVINGQLYVYTGCYATGAFGVFFRYDPGSNTWLRRAAPPTDHLQGAGGVINGKLYLVGGWKASSCEVNGEPAICDDLDNALHVYNPATNAWTRKAFIAVKRTGMSAAVLGGKLFVVGGDTEAGGYDTYVYDPGTNTWAQKAPLPKVTSNGVAAIAGGKLVYVGGAERQPAAPGPSKVYVYNP